MQNAPYVLYEAPFLLQWETILRTPETLTRASKRHSTGVMQPMSQAYSHGMAQQEPLSGYVRATVRLRKSTYAAIVPQRWE